MKKVLRIVGGIATLFAGLFMVYGFFHILNTGEEVNPAIINSVADKIFLFLLIGGCGGAYLTVSMHLFGKPKISFLDKQAKPAVASLLVCIYAMIIGLIYHVIFLSPW